MDVLREIKLLKTQINRHNIRYYVHNDPIISDSEYDHLMNKLLQLEKQFPNYIPEHHSSKKDLGDDHTSKKIFQTTIQPRPKLNPSF